LNLISVIALRLPAPAGAVIDTSTQEHLQ